jgi:hypothetical protein
MVTVRRGPAEVDSAPQATVTAKLSLPIRELAMRDVPLTRAIEQLSDLANLPITLDPTALALTGVAPLQTVTLEMKDGTIERALRDLLSPLRLALVERDGQISIVRAPGRGLLPASYDVSDLVAVGDQDANRIAQLLQRFVAPESWQASGGAGSIVVQGTGLQIKQSEENYIALIVFCERLRVARGLVPKSRYPAERLITDSPNGHLEKKLATHTTFTFAPWTRLADVVRDWSERSGITLLVDWQALGELDLGPSSPISCSAVSQTWQSALDEILAPLGLAWRAIDGTTIQITSAAAAEQQSRIEFIRIPAGFRQQFVSGAAMIEALRNDLAAEGAMGRASLELQIDGDRLIVLGNAAAQQFLSQRLAGE